MESGKNFKIIEIPYKYPKDILDNSKKYYDFDYFDRVRELDFNAYIVSGAGRTFIEFFYDNEVCKRHVKKSIN